VSIFCGSSSAIACRHARLSSRDEGSRRGSGKSPGRPGSRRWIAFCHAYEASLSVVYGTTALDQGARSRTAST
jgi:hypothetical protein